MNRVLESCSQKDTLEQKYTTTLYPITISIFGSIIWESAVRRTGKLIFTETSLRNRHKLENIFFAISPTIKYRTIWLSFGFITTAFQGAIQEYQTMGLRRKKMGSPIAAS